jgi:aminopeptidase N
MVVFELHNALNVNGVLTDDGASVPVDRIRQDNTVRLSFPDELPVGDPVTVTFQYEGELVGTEESPVEDIALASIETERAYLLYPGRWFPVNGYSADRFSSEIAVTVPEGYKVIASGISTTEEVEGRIKHSFAFNDSSFPGSVAVVPGDPVRVEYEGVTTEVYFNSATPETAEAYGAAVGRMVNYYSETFGAPYSTSLVLVETADYYPPGYAAPGVIFMSPWGIGGDVNRMLLGSQVAHQWWRVLVSPGNRNHTWLDLGLAKYSAMLEAEADEGESEFNALLEMLQVDALTYDEIPVLQSGRLPDFSPELNALAASKGAMVMNMLRWTLGADAFFASLRQYLEANVWKSVTTDTFREVAEAVSGKNLEAFFIQWTENNGTPEFQQEYTIFRLGGGKGFRVMGNVSQDMDTFSMPVEIRIETEGEPEYQTIEVQGTSSDFIVDTFGKPSRVILDPNHRILRFDESIHVKVAIRRGEQLVELGYYAEALDEYQKSLDINRYSSLAHYRIGEVFFQQRNYQSAANEFRESLNGDQDPAWTEVWAHISLGKIFDITDQRDRAVNEYQLAIRTRDNTQGALDEARKYLDQPYRRARRQERIY